MPQSSRLVSLLRPPLSEAEKRALLNHLPPGTTVVFEELRSATAEEHFANCELRHDPLVVLPMLPVPSLAIAAGFRHVVISSGGIVHQLVKFNPELHSFML